MTTIDEIGYWDMFINRFRVPLHPFFIKVLNAYGLAPGQFLPHAWHFMSFFKYQCHKLGLNPRVRMFRWLFTICTITKQVGWYFLSRHPKAEANLFPHPPSSNHHWKERFLFVKLPNSQRSEVCNVWLAECETRACNKLKETDLSETDLEHIGKLKGAEPLESRYPLNNAQLCECGIIFPPEPQDFVDEEDKEEEEDENDPVGDARLGFWCFGSGSQPKATETQTENFVLGLTSMDKSKETSKKQKVSSRAGSRATSSSVRPDTPHRPAWGVSVDDFVVLILTLCRIGYGAGADWRRKADCCRQGVRRGEEESNDREQLRREAEKKVEDLSKKVERLKLSNAGMTAKNAELSAHVNDLEAEKSSVALQAVQLFKRSKFFLDQRLRDSKGALMHGYNECKTDVSKDYPELDMSIYEHKFAREVASETERRAEEAEHKKAASSRALTSPSMSRSLGASGSASVAVSRPQLPLAEGHSQEMELPTDAAEQND
ncbi:hypothetical protein RJ639_030407 [Escallonia herrerae]|uniref:Transposase (putative) gypsy type domain-containing protein n=1 Tax=Escallonia herrerae TaxID=1293975 RepID=A0AA88X8U5_9ASTE|nr:hypothetical protein RJ639_030407 [Escallonia herrerae]